MIDFFKKIFKPEGSSTTARERLRLVLLSDHLSLAPEVVESLKLDLIAVISKYVEVDEAACDVTFERQDSAIAMLANIPILAMKTRPPSPPPTPSAPPPAPEPPPSFGTPATAKVAEESPAADQPVPSKPPSAPRRKRRRRRAPVAPALGNAAPAPG
jgi:cell division topological specificity factor